MVKSGPVAIDDRGILYRGGRVVLHGYQEWRKDVSIPEYIKPVPPCIGGG